MQNFPFKKLQKKKKKKDYPDCHDGSTRLTHYIPKQVRERREKHAKQIPHKITETTSKALVMVLLSLTKHVNKIQEKQK